METPSATNITVHPLDRNQRRVLGVLIEKALSTPDGYPLTVNALVAGCNQKSNRAPLTNLEAADVDETLFTLRDAGLVTQVFAATGRTERWKHNVKEKWQLDGPQRAVLAELLLRGPQTEGELRAHASRMTAVESLDALRSILNALADLGFVRRLTSDERKRGVVWTHLLFQPHELARIETQFAQDDGGAEDTEEPARAAVPRSSPGPVNSDQFAEMESEIASLRANGERLSAELEAVRKSHEELKQAFQQFRDALGG